MCQLMWQIYSRFFFFYFLVFTLKDNTSRISNTLPDSQDIIVPHDKTGKPKKKLIQNVSNKCKSEKLLFSPLEAQSHVI
jgi:hypothetical protein